jgi:hypothetical protein
MSDYAIVVQNYNKPDTLRDVCESLLACENRHLFDLIFWSDSAVGGHKETEHGPKVAQSRAYLESFSATHGDQFHSVAIYQNSINLGCYKTCRVAMDKAFEEHDFVVLSEDDCIFSPDALNWFLEMSRSSAFHDDAVWAIAGESIFFDSQKVTLDGQFVADAKNYAKVNRLWEQFITFGFIPSSCFATNRHKWAEFAITRGETNGDVTLCQRCRVEGKKCLFPVVARVKDVGMLHPDGYSVLIHSMENVKEVKNCYLMSGDILPDLEGRSSLRQFDGHEGQLFWRSTQLNGFGDQEGPGGAQGINVEKRKSELLHFARTAGANADWDGALKLWRQLKSIGVTTSEVDTGIGLCLMKKGELDRARTVITNVLSLSPDEPFAQSIMAHILEADRDFAGAEMIWDRLGRREDVPDWLHSNALRGRARCQAALLLT